MKNHYMYVFLIVFFACAQNSKSVDENDPLLEAVAGKDYRDLIRIPVNDNMGIDTSNLPVLQLSVDTLDMGKVKSGKSVEKTISIKNIGNTDMYILDAKSSCGCTVPKFTKEAIPPGEEGLISIKYDSEDHAPGKKIKSVTIKTNCIPNTKEISILATVIK